MLNDRSYGIAYHTLSPKREYTETGNAGDEAYHRQAFVPGCIRKFKIMRVSDFLEQYFTYNA